MKNKVKEHKDVRKAPTRAEGGCHGLELAGWDQSGDIRAERSTWAQDTDAGP